MKRVILITTIIIAYATSICAQDYHARHDSLMVYLSWESMFDGIADTTLLNPEITAYSPYHIEFDGIKKPINKMLKEQTIAVALGDTLWYINSKWLKKNFKGECKHMNDYVPLYFSGKIAFVQWASPNKGMNIQKWLALMEGNVIIDDDEQDAGMLYLINFENMMIEKIDSEKLSELLVNYPDLQRRYESMRDYKETYMINDFFLQYVERLNEDSNVPYLF